MAENWSTQPILNSHAAVAAIVTVLVLLLFVPAFKPLGARRRTTLILLRLGVIALLLLAMLRPTHVSTSTKRQSAVLLVLFDKSRSMQLPHSSGGKSRWLAEREALLAAQPLLEEIARDLDVKLYAYDSQLAAVALAGGKMNLPEKPDGAQTDIGTCLSDAVRQEIGKRLAAVVLLGDGAQTAFEPRIEIHEAGRELARLGSPLYTVVFGPAGDTSQARDVAIENLPEQYTVFVKNELLVKGLLRVRGYVNKDIDVQLVAESRDGKKQVVASKAFQAREDGQQLPVELSYVPPKPGQYTLTLRAADQPGELVTKNNELNAFLTVLEGGLRILYLEGELRQEQMFLRRSLNASPDMQLDFQWIERRQQNWPVDLTQLLKGAEYDAILLGDLDSSALGADNLKLLAQAVESGKGLAVLGGYHSFGAGGYHDTPLADLVPIKLSKFERQDFDAQIRQDMHLAGPVRMTLATPHSITSLAPPDQNELVWRDLNALKGGNKFVGLKDGPGVRVLAQTPDGQPLLVTGEYGRGRVLAFAGDSTWQWWRQGRQAEHKRFWRQVVLWLVRRDNLDQDQVWIKLRQRRFNPGSRVTFSAGAKSATGEVVRDATLRAELLLPDGKREAVRLSPDGDLFNLNGTTDVIREPGDYTVEVTATRGPKTLGSAQATFQILDRDVELSTSAADHEQMARLAELTKEFGGKLLAPEQLPAILREIKARPPELEIEVQTKWQFADTPRGAWLFLLCFVGLLACEWALRKRWGLV